MMRSQPNCFEFDSAFKKNVGKKNVRSTKMFVKKFMW